MRKIYLLSLSVFLLSCSSNIPIKDIYSFEVVEQQATAQWEKYRDTEEYAQFNNDWLSFNNANQIDEKGHCYLIGGPTEVIILIQNRLGTIQNVVVENDNKKTRCFKEAFIGKKYPKPPFSPFYHYMIMKGEDA